MLNKVEVLGISFILCSHSDPFFPNVRCFVACPEEMHLCLWVFFTESAIFICLKPNLNRNLNRNSLVATRLCKNLNWN